MSIRIVLQNSISPALSLSNKDSQADEDDFKPSYSLSIREKSTKTQSSPGFRLAHSSTGLDYAKAQLLWLRTSNGVLTLAKSPLEPPMVEYLLKVIHNLLNPSPPKITGLKTH